MGQKSLVGGNLEKMRPSPSWGMLSALSGQKGLEAAWLCLQLIPYLWDLLFPFVCIKQT